MLINSIWKILLILTAIAFFAYALTPNATLGYLLKLFALNWGIIIVYIIIWPHIRGVRKGDLLVIRSQPISFFFSIPNAVALSNARKNEFIELKLLDGTIGIGKVVKYQGIFSHAEVELVSQNTALIEIAKLK
ncbi:MAG: hypothetical protein NZ903_01540 [Candidatus Micrarchaeota archaeon]|nr:hypothetical protein [Candidatus Micrarchaeota archaeon]